MAERVKTSAMIKNQRMPELVMAKLMDWIMDGTLSMGDKLVAEDLASKMGVSRMPVREALKNMEKSGIVESVPYVGTRVVELTMSDIIQIYTMRKALEPIASYNACKRISDETIKKLQTIQDKLEEVLFKKNPDPKKVFVLNREFHFTMYEACEMRYLVNTISNLWDYLAFFKLIYGRKYVTDSDSAKRMVKEHRAYIDYLIKRDAETLQKAVHDALDKHITGMSENISDYLVAK